jgi:hypothetical protein
MTLHSFGDDELFISIEMAEDHASDQDVKRICAFANGFIGLDSLIGSVAAMANYNDTLSHFTRRTSRKETKVRPLWGTASKD